MHGRSRIKLWGAVALAALVALTTAAAGAVFVIRRAAPSATILPVDESGGPPLAGPWQEPFACTTELLRLGPPGAECSIPSTVTQWSITSTGVEPLDPFDGDDVAGAADQTRIRVEIGVVNRSIYTIAIPDRGTGGGHVDPASWNGRVLYQFGGGCGAGYGQGFLLGTADTGAWLDQIARSGLEDGYAVVTSTLNYFGNSCNDVVSAETAALVLDRFAISYGEPVVTIGRGGSGGSMAMFLLAQNYPGLLDGIVATLPFPDWISPLTNAYDCRLLAAFYRSDRGKSFTDDQQAAVNGHATAGTCRAWDAAEDIVDMTLVASHCPFWVESPYDPDDNPDGPRCTVFDNNVNILGRDDEGVARRPLDNVGVQYGLDAAQKGVISVDQFLDLNEDIGGFDADGAVVAERTATTEDVAARAYRTGRVLHGKNLHALPTVLVRTDLDELGDIHTKSWALSLRERVEAAAGADPSSLVLWTALDDTAPLEAAATQLVDHWATLVRNDGVSGDAVEVAARRPPEAVDLCARGDRVLASGEDVHDDGGPCDDAAPPHLEPRTAAGAPLANDIVKCRLRPVDESDYGTPLEPGQAARLRAIFPEGVCDWSRPGVGQRPPDKEWRSYGE